MTAKVQADRLTDLGSFYLTKNHPQLAYTTCQEALKADVSSPAARSCVDKAIASLQSDRKSRFYSRLTAIDAELDRGEKSKAIDELSRLHSELVPPDSPLGDFDPAMYRALNTRFSRAKPGIWIPLLFTAARILLWIAISVVALWVLAAVLGQIYTWLANRSAYRKSRLERQNVDWTVWSILDTRNQGGAGPVMDSLNPLNNPLLRDFRPSSLLLMPPLNISGAADPNQPLEIWRDFLDEPRAPIGMEDLPLHLFRRHRFIQEEAFDELDVKIGGFEAKGLIGLIRMARRWADRGLPAAQGLIFTLPETNSNKSFACVRITCNWTTALNAMRDSKAMTDAEEEKTSESVDPEGSHGDTLSVFASSEEDPSIDAVALSAQRAAFKLFHRLALKSSPSYSSAVANFHQGVSLLDQYL
jgi:hypothetical protein